MLRDLPNACSQRNSEQVVPGQLQGTLPFANSRLSATHGCNYSNYEIVTVHCKLLLILATWKRAENYSRTRSWFDLLFVLLILVTRA